MQYKTHAVDTRFIDIDKIDDRTRSKRNSNIKVYQSKEFGFIGEFRNPQIVGRIITFKQSSYRISDPIDNIKGNVNFRYKLVTF